MLCLSFYAETTHIENVNIKCCLFTFEVLEIPGGGVAFLGGWGGLWIFSGTTVHNVIVVHIITVHVRMYSTSIIFIDGNFQLYLFQDNTHVTLKVHDNTGYVITQSSSKYFNIVWSFHCNA